MGRRTTEEQRAKHREEQRRYAQRYPDRIKKSHRKWVEKNGYVYSKKKIEAQRLYRIKRNAESYDECDKELYYTKWTQEEIDFLIENYPKMTLYQISKELGRTIMAVERKRHRLGLTKEVADE